MVPYMPAKALFRGITLIPLLAPTLLSAISLIYWFGNQGVLKELMQALGIEEIYGAPGIVLAEKLLATAPQSLTRVFYAGDGASAVGAALKIAYQAHAQRGTVRPLYAHVAEGYHRDTLGAVSVGGIDLFHHTYRSIMLETRQVSSPGVLQEGQTRAGRAVVAGGSGGGLFDPDGHPF